MHVEFIKKCCEKIRIFDTDAIQGIDFVQKLINVEYIDSLIADS